MSPQPQSVEVVLVLVHGTFAAQAGWMQNGSLCRKILGSESGDRVSFVPFGWTGKNNQEARLAASRDLVQTVRSQLEGDPSEKRVVILAHSHGGNIALKALEELHSVPQVAGVVCMATPYFSVRVRNTPRVLSVLPWVFAPFACWAFSLAALIPLAIVYGPALLVSKMMDWPVADTYILVFLPLALVVMVAYSLRVYLRLCARIRTVLDKWIDQRAHYVNKRYAASPGRVPVMSVGVSIDEASLWLRVIAWFGSIPFLTWRPWIFLCLCYAAVWLAMIFPAAGTEGLWPDPTGRFQTFANTGAFEFFSAPFFTVQRIFFDWFMFPLLGFFALLLIWQFAMAIIPFLMRTSPIVFGTESVLDNLVADVRTCSKPVCENLTSVRMARKGIWPLEHCRIYDDPPTLSAVASWIRRVAFHEGKPEQAS